MYRKSSLNVVLTFPEIATLSEANFPTSWHEAVAEDIVRSAQGEVARLSDDVIASQTQQRRRYVEHGVSNCSRRNNETTLCGTTLSEDLLYCLSMVEI